MKKIVRLTESDLVKLVNNVINEQTLLDCKTNITGTLIYDATRKAWLLKSAAGFCKVPTAPAQVSQPQVAQPTPNPPYSRGACFTTGTLVTLADGTKKAIGTIETGSEVLSSENKTSIVSEIEVHSVNNLSIITLSNGNVIETTDTHAFFVKDKGLAVISPELYEESYGDKLEQLVEGDLLIDVDGNNLSIETIKSVTLESEIKVFNLRLKGEENYYVNDVLVSD
jgi:hypothetical protein